MALAPPAFQFYAADFLVSVSTFSNEEVGAYIRLLCHQWVNGGVPNDPRSIAKILHTSGLVSRRIWSKLAPKFALCDDKLLRNPRLEEVRGNAVAFSQLQTERAKLRWSDRDAAAMPARGNALHLQSSVRTEERTRQTAEPHPVENSGRRKPKPDVRKLAAMILREAILQIPRIADQAEAAKYAAAKFDLSYDSRSIANALASAQAQAAKRSKVTS